MLQFALTLENLESTFYNQALDRFDEQAFANAGYEPWVRGRFEQIREHQQMHVDVLTQALGSDAPQPCTYNTYVSFEQIQKYLAWMCDSVLQSV